MPLTLGQFRKRTKYMDDGVNLEIFNSGSEWYGIEQQEMHSWSYKDGSLILNFGGNWSEYDEQKYLEYQFEQLCDEVRQYVESYRQFSNDYDG